MSKKKCAHAASGLNLLNFFNFFAFKTEKFHLTPENRARTAKLNVPITNRFQREKYIEICTLDMWENFFGVAVRCSYFKIPKVSKEVGLTCVLLIIKIFIF